MAKVRNVSDRSDKPKVRVVRVKNPVRLTTLEDPQDGTQEALGAFCRIRPPDGLSEHEVASWRHLVSQVALAVKVLPTPKDADVPDDSKRIEEGEHVGSIRQEALQLAEETKNPLVMSLVTEILDQVGIR